MSPDNRYQQKLPGVFRRVGQFIIDHADQLGGILEGTTDYQLTISLKPGDGDTIFEPTITAEHTAVVMPAMKYYYDLDGEPPWLIPAEEAK